MNNMSKTTKNILTVLIVIATFIFANNVGLIGLFLGLIVLGIIGFITNKKAETKSSIVRVIVGVLLAIVIFVALIILICWLIDYLTFVA